MLYFFALLAGDHDGGTWSAPSQRLVLFFSSSRNRRDDLASDDRCAARLANRPARIPLVLLVLLAGYFCVGRIGSWFYSHPESWEVLSWLLVICFILKLSVSLGLPPGFAEISSPLVRLGPMPAFGSPAQLFSPCWLISSALDFCPSSISIALIVSLLFPSLRVALSPLALD